eukprot:CAMPEP_0114228438 /NCGR_PEP_ID=MMETSP0058-20121206/2345_1 /TAXON_ID=36894 /ORGANISM="Pyramimonas parkeae, CCMP726" /LENGTH=424 /DNA_ID=CAMNT_0001339389 /DNA_START=152 /DNA_END=1428 /DNA_ORIENTATION=+
MVGTALHLDGIFCVYGVKQWKTHFSHDVHNEIAALQHPAECGCDTQAIRFTWSGDAGLAGNVHRLALAIELGLATDRIVIEYTKPPAGSPIWKGYTSLFGDTPVSHSGACSNVSGFDCMFSRLASCTWEQVDRPECLRQGTASLASQDFGVFKLLNPNLDRLHRAAHPAPAPGHPPHGARLVEFQYFGRELQWSMFMSGERVPRLAALGSFGLRSGVVAALWRPQPRLMALASRRLEEFAGDLYGGKAFPGSSHLSRRQRYVAVHIRQTDMMRAVASDALRFNTEHYIPSTYLDLAARVARWHNVSKVFVESDSGSVFEALSQDAYEGIEWVYYRDSYRPKRGVYPEFIANDTNGDPTGELSLRTAVDMISAMELFRNADAVVGSMLSNVFRLACERMLQDIQGRDLGQVVNTMTPKGRLTHEA